MNDTDYHLHVIAFDVPYPANYGGVIDVFYRVKALSEAGVKVHLHCFEYGRGKAEVLNRCHEVKYYKRDTSFWKQFRREPYVVASRRSEALLKDLLKDDYPILCEGLHTTAVLTDPRLAGRKIFVRAHNVEHDYYRLLAESEPRFWKRCFYRMEAKKLKRYEPVLKRAAGIFAITRKDADYFNALYGRALVVPGFSALSKVCSETGRGDYVLYHGNLSVVENRKAAEWLVEEVFSQLDLPCVVAGLNPPDSLKEAVEPYPNVTLKANLEDAEMMDLIRNAQVNVMVTDQPTGLKLKLLNALYNGRFCLVNDDMVRGTALDRLCVVAETPEQFVGEIRRLMEEDFTEEDMVERDEAMKELYQNDKNALLLIHAIFGNV
ncbi:MAG: glycosyltransferase [Bacteroidales bacterium]|nr:glycosyltransferase [Bacteroidales bacterium]